MSDEHQEEKKRKIKVKLVKSGKYNLQVIFGLVGGFILFILGAIGSAGFYQTIIAFGVDRGIIPEEYGTLVLAVLLLLANGGGLTVIAGSLLIKKVRALANWLIGIGAGISLLALLTRVIILGPIIQEYMSLAYQDVGYLYKAAHLLGVEIGLLGLGVILAFMATFEEYYWTAILGSAAIFSMFAGLSANPSLFAWVSETVTNNILASLINTFLALMLYVGVLLFIGALLVGKGLIKLTKFMVFIVFVATIFSVVSIFWDLTAITDYASLYAFIQYLRFISVVLVYYLGIRFIRKA